MSDFSWQSVPCEKLSSWRRAFELNPGNHDVEAGCPVCGKPELHRYYQVGPPIDRIVNGVVFVARGACWEWCSSCLSYEHYSALVPDWWHSNLAVDESLLTAYPDVLEHAVKQQS